MCPFDLKSMTAFFWRVDEELFRWFLYDRTIRAVATMGALHKPWGEGTCWHDLQWRRCWACRPVFQSTAQLLQQETSPCQWWCSPWTERRWFQGNQATSPVQCAETAIWAFFFFKAKNNQHKKSWQILFLFFCFVFQKLTWIGAGRRANSSFRAPLVYPFILTRIWIPSWWIRSAAFPLQGIWKQRTITRENVFYYQLVSSFSTQARQSIWNLQSPKTDSMI